MFNFVWKNASDTHAVLPEAYMEGTMKKSGVFEWHEGVKHSSHVKITNEENACHFCITGIVYFEFIPQSQTVNQTYLEILKWSHEAVHRKEPELWQNNWILKCGDAPVHKALSVQLFLAQKLTTEMEHTAFSPDLAPYGF